MLFIVSAENRALFGADIDQMHRQRKRVFVDRCGWRIPTVRDMEIDAYDRDDTIYLIAKETADAPVTGSLRLLPTDKPHLMRDVFSAACGGAPPRGPSIWEASRFCIAPEVRSRRARVGLVPQFICGVLETALLFGVERIVFATHRGLLPIVLDCGWSAMRLGASIPDGDDEITAVGACISPEGLRNVRRRFRITGPVTRFLTHARPLEANATHTVARRRSA